MERRWTVTTAKNLQFLQVTILLNSNYYMWQPKVNIEFPNDDNVQFLTIITLRFVRRHRTGLQIATVTMKRRPSRLHPLYFCFVLCLLRTFRKNLLQQPRKFIVEGEKKANSIIITARFAWNKPVADFYLGRETSFLFLTLQKRERQANV